MTTTPTAPTGPGDPGDPGGPAGSSGPEDEGPRITGEAARDLGSLRRTVRGAPEGRRIAGVAGGVARHFDIDPTVVRVAMVVLAFFGGAGIVLYAAGWLLIPEEDTDHAVVRMDGRSRSLVLYVVAGVAGLALLGDTVGGYHFPWPVVVIGLIVLVVLGRRGKLAGREDADEWVGWVPWNRPTGSDPEQPVDLAKGTARAGTPGDPTTDPATGTAPWATTRAPSDPAEQGQAPQPVRPAVRPPVRAVPRDPRKRGPRLFGLVLAAIALGVGVLGMADVAGANIARPAYPALALGIIGAGLVLGSFWGRAGGLTFLGLIGTVALVGSVAANEWDLTGRHIVVAPTSAASLRSGYHFDLGDARIDLSRIDPTELAGRTLHVAGDVGQIRITVPEGVEVHAQGSIDGPGRVELFGASRSGFSSTLTQTRTVSPAPAAKTRTPVLTIDTALDMGSIQVLDEDDPDAYRSLQ